jgi:hypothetical protein
LDELTKRLNRPPSKVQKKVVQDETIELVKEDKEDSGDYEDAFKDGEWPELKKHFPLESEIN